MRTERSTEARSRANDFDVKLVNVTRFEPKSMEKLHRKDAEIQTEMLENKLSFGVREIKSATGEYALVPMQGRVN